MLYKVTVGDDVYLGTPEQVVLWMSKADGAPAGDLATYMAGIAARIARAAREAPPIDVSDALAFLESLRDARLVQLEERTEASAERVDPKSVVDAGPVTFGENVTLEDLERDVFEGMDR